MTKKQLAATELSVDQQLAAYRMMLEIRQFEDECHRMFAAGLVRGSTHLGQGQEAVSVGASLALRDGDTMTCTYRGHAATLAMGAPLDRSFGEILGKADGLCGGKGGSMHLTHVESGAMGSFAIVGGHLPIACGFAFASRYRGSGEVSVCFFGDGSTNIGAFHESLNLAAVWKLPVIFICENNLYGEYSPLASTTPIEDLFERSASYGMPGVQVDGNDLGQMHSVVSEAVDRARTGDGPTLVEALTYRHKGHSRSDPATYRPDGELESWLEKDPIRRCEQSLIEADVDQGRLDDVKAGAIRTVEDALERAKSWPEPLPDSRWEHVYA
jgi:pyruvate dehydrogenase E1 component alpha subunit